MKCRICNIDILGHGVGMHVREHTISYAQYVSDWYDKFPNDFYPQWKRCVECGVLIKGTHRKTCSKMCGGKYRSKIQKGRLWGTAVSHDALESMRKKAVIRFRDKRNHPMYGKHHSLCTIEKLRTAGKTYTGERNGMFGKTHTPDAIKRIFAKRPMNKLEQLVAETLQSHNIPFHYQFFLKDGDVCKSFDFKILDRKILIEVDGDFWHGNPNTKYHVSNINEVKKNDHFKEKLAKKRGYVVLRFWESDIKKNPNIIIDKLG